MTKQGQRAALLVGRTEQEVDALFPQVAPLLYVLASCGLPDVQATLETFPATEVIVSTVPLDEPPRPTFVWQGEQANAGALQVFLEALEAETTVEEKEEGGEEVPVPPAASLFGAEAVVVPTVRIGFYGARGGVGVTMAAVHMAQALARHGYRVLLADPTLRFDSWIYAGVVPPDCRAVEGGERAQTPNGRITLLAGEPDEADLRGFDALVVDGGRRYSWRILVTWQRLEQRLEVEAIEAMIRQWQEVA